MKMNWFKTTKGIGGVTTAAIITVTLTVITVSVWNIKSAYDANNMQKVEKKPATTNKTVNHTRTQEAAYIHPPIKGVNVPFKKYSLDAHRGATLAYKGSKITIPAGIFCDAQGKEVTGKVDIKYREFHDPIDFFLSGIPMTYDSGGKQYTFESAGMVDIRGEKDGMPVYLKQGASLKIEMPSERNGDHYNLYSLDTVNRKWIFQSANTASPDNVITQPAVVDNDTLALVKKEIEDLVASKPVKPRKADSKQTSFRISADATDFPELSMYRTTLFEVDNKNKNFSKEYGKVTWNDVSLSRLGNGDRYMITLGKDSESHNFMVYPVFDPKDYKIAMKEYNKKYDEYQAELKKIKEQKLTGVDISKLIAAASKEQVIEDNMNETSHYVNNTLAVNGNYMLINTLGVWNCDHPCPLPTSATLAATFMCNSDTISGTEIYLVEKERNMIFQFYTDRSFSFNPKATNFAWCVTRQNRIAIFTSADFQGIPVTHGLYTFNMKMVDKEITSGEDVRKIFKGYM